MQKRKVQGAVGQNLSQTIQASLLKQWAILLVATLDAVRQLRLLTSFCTLAFLSISRWEHLVGLDTSRTLFLRVGAAFGTAATAWTGAGTATLSWPAAGTATGATSWTAGGCWSPLSSSWCPLGTSLGGSSSTSSAHPPCSAEASSGTSWATSLKNWQGTFEKKMFLSNFQINLIK